MLSVRASRIHVLTAVALCSALHAGDGRQAAVERGLRFIYQVASNPKDFDDWGHDMLWCFYSISATAKDPELRAMAYRMGHERAIVWRRRHPDPPLDDADALSNFVFGTDAAERLGVEDPTMRERVRKAVARFTAMDFLDFDPTREPPPSDLPRECSKCHFQNRRGATVCERCKTPLKMESRYEVWLDALIETYTGDVYGVNLGASYDDVLRWITVMRPYVPKNRAEASDITYAITHVVYTLNDYGKYRLSRKWLPQEFEYLKANMTEAADKNDSETLGEFMDTLRAFGMTSNDKLIRLGMAYQLSHQNPDGSWGNLKSKDAYTRYHTTWTAIDGLREYAFQGERLRRPELMKLITSKPHRDY
jgi:hypothetical protein